MSNGHDNDDDDVGYGRPPTRNRFKKGQSGNPKGRPKGAKNFATALSTELNGRIVISENGKRRKISRREVIAKQLVNRAVTGDHKSLPILFNETRALETAPPPVTAAAVVRQEDQAVMKGILKRLRAADEAQKAAAATPSPAREPDDTAGEDDSTAEIIPDDKKGDPDADV